MGGGSKNIQSAQVLNDSQLMAWRIVQIIFWVIGLFIFLSLIFIPEIGLHALWNILIPVAPLLIVMIPGFWRNVCPLGSVSLIGRHLGWSKKRRVSRDVQGKFTLFGVLVLLVVIPMRHLFLNTNGPATALLLFILAITAFISGLIYDWKSAWCSGLCPVHQVEKLYGIKGIISLPNAHCQHCHNCTIPCPDSTEQLHPITSKYSSLSKVAGMLLIGGFPGFVWGWFQTPDYSQWESWGQVGYSFAFPLGGFTVSMILFLLLKKYLLKRYEQRIILFFTAAAVSIYYWYRLPALLGMGYYAGDGMLINLSSSLPDFFPIISGALTTGFFFWWFLFRESTAKSWVIRPPYYRAKRK